MGLKQSIVVVNEYTVKTGKKSGSRGGTPGDYVLRYMARDGATEDLTPVRLQDTDAYITRYMARKEATETLDSVQEIKKGMRKVQGYAGLAFGNDDVSMSHAKVKAVSRDIQKQFDSGKTVMKTVLSFDEDYLRKNHIISDDFVCEKQGDFRGNVDQMKLRLAIMDGMKKMSRDYDDLEWIGVIQVDTMHLHCHLCMVDKGVGNITKDGTQRGKITEKSKRILRRGIDDSLDGGHFVKMLTSNITNDKRNAKCFIKKYAHKTMAEHGTPQFLIACLPEDTRLWRAGTNRKEMKKANYIVREYVEQVLDMPDSGYKEAIREIDEYARTRQRREGFSNKEYRRLVTNGRERLVEDCMNSVYAVLKQIPAEERAVRTPMMDVMSTPYEDIANTQATDPMVEFGFKLRSYSSRLNHHKNERHKYHELCKLYEDAREHGDVSEDSKPLYEFYKVEEDYNAKLMCKYQYFLSFLPSDEEYEGDFQKILDYRDRMRRLRLMKDDKSIRRMGVDSAEDYGRRVYDMHGGRFVVTAPVVLENRLDAMQSTYEDMLSDFKYKLDDYGLTLDASDESNLKVSTGKAYSFDDVKALDLHHLGYDFPYDAQVSKVNVDKFVEITDQRYEAFCGAYDYLVDSDQSDAVKDIPMRDIVVMKEMSDMLQSRAVIPSSKMNTSGGRHKAKTVSLDVNYDKDIETVIKATVQSVTFGE